MFLLILLIFFNLNAELVDLVFADSFLRKKDCLSASEHYQKNKNKFNPVVFSNLAISLYCLNDKKEAEKKIKKSYEYVIKEKWNNLESEYIKFNYAFILVSNKKYQEALAVLQMIEHERLSSKQQSLFLSLMCNINFYNDNFKDAENNCKKAYMLDSSTCFVKYNYALILYKLNNNKEAVNLFLDVYNKCPEQKVAYYYALTLYKLGYKQAACDVLSKFLVTTQNEDLYGLIKRELNDD